MTGTSTPQFVFLICSIMLSLGLSAQFELQAEWEKSYISPVGGKAQSWGVDVDAEGNIYYPANIDSLNQNYDIVCYKYDTDGNMLWPSPVFYGGLGAQQAYVCVEEGDEFYIGGRFCLISGFSCEMTLLKVDKATGTIIWDAEQDFGNNGYDEVDGLSIQDDGIYCGGWGQAIQTGWYQNDMGLWKLNHDGTTEWTNYLGQEMTSEHLDGHFVLDDEYIYGAGLWGGTNYVLNLHNGHSFLGKFSRTDGSLVDSVLFGSQSDEILDIDNALGMTSDGEFLYITGYTVLPGESDWQIFIAKYDFDLNEIWYEDFGASGTETARGIITHGDRIYVAGTTESEELMTGGDMDALLLEYDKNGTYLSHYTWGGTDRDAFRDIVIHDEAIYLPGATAPNGGEDSVAFLVKASLENVVNTIGDLESDPLMSIYSDQPSNRITIHPPAGDWGSSVEIEIRDISGRLIKEITAAKSAYYGLSNIEMPKGIYLLGLSDGEKRISKPFVW